MKVLLKSSGKLYGEFAAENYLNLRDAKHGDVFSVRTVTTDTSSFNWAAAPTNDLAPIKEWRIKLELCKMRRIVDEEEISGFRGAKPTTEGKLGAAIILLSGIPEFCSRTACLNTRMSSSKPDEYEITWSVLLVNDECSELLFDLDNFEPA